MPSFSNMSINAMHRAAKTSVFEYRQPAADIEARLSRAQLEKKNSELIQDLEKCEKEKKELESVRDNLTGEEPAEPEESAEPEDRGAGSDDSDGTRPPLATEPSFLNQALADLAESEYRKYAIYSTINRGFSLSGSAEHPTALNEKVFDELETKYMVNQAVLGGGYVKAVTKYFPEYVVMVQMVAPNQYLEDQYFVYLAKPDAALGEERTVTMLLAAEEQRLKGEEEAKNEAADGERLRRAEAMKPVGPTGPSKPTSPKQPNPTPPPPNRSTTRPPITVTSRGNVVRGIPLDVSVESNRPTEITPELYKYLDVSFKQGDEPPESESLVPHPARRGWSMEFPEHFLWVRNYKNPSTGRVSWWIYADPTMVWELTELLTDKLIATREKKRRVRRR